MKIDYRYLFEQTPIGLALCDLDGNIVECNQGFADILGVDVASAKRLNYWNITPEEYHPIEKQILHIMERLKEYGPYEKEYIFQGNVSNDNASRTLIPVSLRATRIEMDKKPFIWSAVTKIDRLGGDIKLLFQRLPVAVCVSDVEGNLVAANDSYAELIGRSLRETLTISYWNITPKAFLDEEMGVKAKLLKDGRSDGYIKHYLRKTEGPHAACGLELVDSLDFTNLRPEEGESLIIVADVDHKLYFRMIDCDGKIVVDTDESRLMGKAAEIEGLKRRLVGLQPRHVFTDDPEKADIIAAVAAIIDRYPTATTPIIVRLELRYHVLLGREYFSAVVFEEDAVVDAGRLQFPVDKTPIRKLGT